MEGRGGEGEEKGRGWKGGEVKGSGGGEGGREVR